MMSDNSDRPSIIIGYDPAGTDTVSVLLKYNLDRAVDVIVAHTSQPPLQHLLFTPFTGFFYTRLDKLIRLSKRRLLIRLRKEHG